MARLFFVMLAIVLAAPAVTAQAAGKAKVEAETLAPLGVARKDASPDSAAPEAARPVEDAPMTAAEQALLLCQTAQMMGAPDVAPGGTPGAGAEYQPGVDAYGRAVTPADGHAQPVFTLPEAVEIPLNIDVLKTVGIITAPTPGLSTNVGKVTILKGGKVLFNGQDAGSDVQTYCNTHLNSQKVQ